VGGCGWRVGKQHKGFLPGSLVFFFQRDSLTCQQRGSCGGCPPNIAPTAPAAARHISASARTAAPTAVLMARSMAPPITSIVFTVHFHDQHNDRLTIALISHRFEAVAARAAHCMVIAAWQPRMLRGLGACLGVFVSVVAGAGPRAVLTPVQERVVSFTSHSLHTMHDHAHHSLTLTRVIWPSCVA
jgi:hypothetical protein